MRRSNCVFYALTQWLKPAPPGEESYLVIRRSRIRWGVLHMLHGTLDKQTGQIRVTSYRPPDGHVKTGFAPVFNGNVVEGDMPLPATEPVACYGLACPQRGQCRWHQQLGTTQGPAIESCQRGNAWPGFERVSDATDRP